MRLRCPYRPYSWRQNGKELRLLFRDHYHRRPDRLQYARMAPPMPPLISRPHPPKYAGLRGLVPIILDGENAWDWYETNGRPFLRELYRPSRTTPLQALTVSGPRAI